MNLGKVHLTWKNEYLGLSMVIASLAVIMVTIFLLFSYQQHEKTAHIRVQGSDLARILSRIPYEQFVPDSGHQGILLVLQQSHRDSAFAYVTVVDLKGSPVAEITSPGIIVPAASPPTDPTTWLGERVLSLQSSGREIHEFHAPVFDDGQIAGYIRLGYMKPDFGLKSADLPFFATFALPIFMLTPMFYFLIRREVRPLKQVNNQLEKLVEQGGTLSKVELSATGELHDFMSRFNQFVESAQTRVSELEVERTELLTSTKLLTYKRSRMETVLQSFPDAVVVLDESGSVSLSNARLGTVLGMSSDDVIGKKPAEWCDEPEVIAFLAAHEGKRLQGYNTAAIEFTPQARHDKTIRMSPYPLFSQTDDSQLLGTLVIFRDISAEKLARESSGEFVAHVSHELKTPLNVMSMYVESLQGEDGKNEEFRVEACNVLHDEVERLSMLIDNILSITKIEMGSINIERKRVKLRDLLQDIFDACVRGGKDKNLKFDLDLPREISPVALDKDLMRIAINNLMTNAIKYTDPGGAVTLSVQENEMMVRVSVIDEGIGIASDEQGRIFEKFYRSENKEVRKRSGHGLGLSLSREIIQLHHGTLTVNSILGKGTEFTVEFNKESSLLKQAV